MFPGDFNCITLGELIGVAFYRVLIRICPVLLCFNSPIFFCMGGGGECINRKGFEAGLGDLCPTRVVLLLCLERLYFRLAFSGV
jgi:hypothetical protein